MSRTRADELQCTYLSPGDVLIARMPDPLGRACVFPPISQPCVSVVDVCIVRTGNPGVDPRWLMYAVNAPEMRHRIEAQQKGTTRKRISKSRLLELEFPLPPLAEQRRIVDALETQFTRLDAAVATLERAQIRLSKLTAAVLRAAADGRLTGGTTGWRNVTVADAGEVLLGRQRAPQYLTGTNSRPYLRVANVKDNRLDLGDIKQMDFDPTHFEKYRLQPGDILVSEGQSPELVGQSAIYRGGVDGLCFQKTLHRFRAYDRVCLPEFAQLVFRAHVRSGQFQRYASITTNIAHLVLRRFKAVPFPLPPINEQMQIVARAEAVLHAVDRTTRTVSAELTRLRNLRQCLLRRALSGRLVPQDSADEPASVLLERIRRERAAAAPSKCKPSRSRT